QLTLDGRVLYAKGTVTNVKAVTTPVFSVQVPEQTNTAETVEAVLSVDRTGAGVGLPQQVTFQVAGEAFTMNAAPGQVTRRTVELPTSQRLGERTIDGEVTAGPLTLARVGTLTTVRTPTEVTFDPKVKAASPLATQLTVTVTNHRSRTALDVSRLEWQVNEGTAYLGRGICAEDFQVPPSSSRSCTVDVQGVTPWNRYWAAAHITENGVRTPVGTWTGWGAVQPDGTSTATPLDLATQTTRRYPNGYQGDADLSGTVRPQYTDEGLVLRASVTDNALHQPATDPANMWQGDSIQFAVTPAHPGYSTQYVEIGASLVNGVPRVHTWRPPPGQQAGTTPGATATVVREGTVTDYTITVPWASLGLAGKPTSSVGLGVVVNDDDNDGRGRNWVEWGTGIANSAKTSTGLRAVQLTDA
ncbi:sugar-binding protein, partial [Wenjunlia vitaminophila]